MHADFCLRMCRNSSDLLSERNSENEPVGFDLWAHSKTLFELVHEICALISYAHNNFLNTRAQL